MKNILLTYFNWLLRLFLFIFLTNILFYRYINIISFTNLFLVIIPNWFFTFYLYFITNKNNKILLEDYMKKNYPKILNDFYDSYINYSNPESKPIYALFLNKELLKDDYISQIKNNSNQAIMLFVCMSAITIMTFLISTVFIMKRMY